MFGVAVLILAFVTAAILDLVTSPANPFTWLLLVLVLVFPFIYSGLMSGQ
jgi:hypothetical protein